MSIKEQMEIINEGDRLRKALGLPSVKEQRLENIAKTWKGAADTIMKVLASKDILEENKYEIIGELVSEALEYQTMIEKKSLLEAYERVVK